MVNSLGRRKRKKGKLCFAERKIKGNISILRVCRQGCVRSSTHKRSLSKRVYEAKFVAVVLQHLCFDCYVKVVDAWQCCLKVF